MPDTTKNRREFLKACVTAGAAGLWVMLIPRPADAQRVHQIDPSLKTPDWMNHYYAYVIDLRKCIGCGNCVRACKRENKVDERFFRTWVERYQITDDDHVSVDSPNGGYDGFTGNVAKGKVTRAFFVPKMCNHCRNTPCTQVCPVHASYQTPEGVVLVDKKRCIGCAYCVQACPYGSRFIDPLTHTADKCTWCYHRITKGLLPACVTVCPTKTRRFGDLKDENDAIRELVHNELTNVLKPDLNTEPFCFYIGFDRAIR